MRCSEIGREIAALKREHQRTLPGLSSTVEHGNMRADPRPTVGLVVGWGEKSEIDLARTGRSMSKPPLSCKSGFFVGFWISRYIFKGV